MYFRSLEYFYHFGVLMKGKKIDKPTVAALLAEGRVFFSDLTSQRTGKSYAAAILLDDNGDKVRFKLEFVNERKSA